MKVDLLIIGGGPAGLAAAIAAKEAGVDSLLILERDARLGGILNQCIHNGFGLHTFKEELTGPEYAGRYIQKVKELEIPYRLDTIVIDLAKMPGNDMSGAAPSGEGPGLNGLALGSEVPGMGGSAPSGEGPGLNGLALGSEVPGLNGLALGSEVPGMGGSAPDSELPGLNGLALGSEVPGMGDSAPDSELPNQNDPAPSSKSPGLCGSTESGCGRKLVTAMSREEGLYTIDAGAVILAMGCRERPRGALNIPGFRPAGIYSAGTAQRYVNMEGRMPGREVVILGSGDIGLIMARRMTLEGAKVKLVAELMPYSGGLKRNIVQCLDDYGIPLRLRTTVVDIKGRERMEAVVIARVDENSRPIPGTEEEIPCDTLLLSCGLIPENELSGRLGLAMNPATGGPLVNESLETDVQGVFACGNVLHVHDLVDYVSEEAAQAGRKAAAYLQGSLRPRSQGQAVSVRSGSGVRYTVPASLDPDRMGDTQLIRFRVDNVYRDKKLEVCLNGRVISSRKKRMLAPGEMEQVVLKKADIEGLSELCQISLQVAD